MPLITLCGLPSSGKTTQANKIAEHIRARLTATEDPGTGATAATATALVPAPTKNVVIINEESLGIVRADGYKDSTQEKITRGTFKAAVERAITKDTIAIADSLNYIKGYRYELYCLARAAATPHCVVFCDISAPNVQKWNTGRTGDKWPDQLQAELIMRFEKPNPKQRWDNPCFVVKANGELPLDDIASFVLQDKANSTHNMATQYSNVADTSFLFSIDQVTQDVVAAITEGQNSGILGQEIVIPGATKKLKLNRNVSLAELRRIRKQFITLTKQVAANRLGYASDSTSVANNFVDYLSQTVNSEKAWATELGSNHPFKIQPPFSTPQNARHLYSTDRVRGGFAHSSGLESAMQLGLVLDETSLEKVVSVILLQTAQAQLPFVREAYLQHKKHSDFESQFSAFDELDRLFQATNRSNAVSTRASTSMGRAMLIAAAGSLPQASQLKDWKLRIRKEDSPCNYPTIFGTVCAVAGLQSPSIKIQRMFLFLTLRGLVSSAVRLNIVGPLVGQGLQLSLSKQAEVLLQRYSELPLDDVSQPAPLVDLIQASHDKWYSRLFNS